MSVRPFLENPQGNSELFYDHRYERYEDVRE